jgi:hypothetical protein
MTATRTTAETAGAVSTHILERASALLEPA